MTAPSHPAAPRSAGAQDGPAAPTTVVHAFAGRAGTAARAQIEIVLGLHEVGWAATVVLPTLDSWAAVAEACSAAGARVARVVAGPSSGVAVVRYGLRTLRPLRARLDGWGPAVVHAHDDAAALLWGPPARAAGVPMVWDADLQRPPAALDRVRFATASYLVVDGRGRRRAGARRLPPHHRRGAAPQAEVPAVAAAYEQLTGRAPVAAADPASPDGLAAPPDRGPVDAAR